MGTSRIRHKSWKVAPPTFVELPFNEEVLDDCMMEIRTDDVIGLRITKIWTEDGKDCVEIKAMLVTGEHVLAYTGEVVRNPGHTRTLVAEQFNLRR